MNKRNLLMGLLSALLVFALFLPGAAPVSAVQPLQTQPTETPEAPEAQPQAQNGFQAGVLAQFQDQLTDLYEQVQPSVVAITTYGQPGSGSPFGGFPGGQQGPRGEDNIVPLGAGSGFVWDEQGHIVTNNHVVEGSERVEVTFSNGSTVSAQVVGTDPDSDLAVLEIDSEPEDIELQPIELSSLNNVQVGQLAIALGNPFGLQGSMTIGIVSAIGRSMPAGMGPASYIIPSMIQTDAPINPGNSGGVLVNIQGELIGVPSSIQSTTGVGSGVGFAIPADIVSRVVPALIEEGVFEHSYLGLSGTPLTPAIAEQMGLDRSTSGVLVINTAEGGPAAEAGLEGGEEEVTINGQPIPIGGSVITAINGQAVQDMNDLINELTFNTSPGDEVTLTVIRDGESEEVEVTLGTRPAATPTPAFPTQPGQGDGEDEGQEGGQSGEGNQQGRGDGVLLGVRVMELTPDMTENLDLPESSTGAYVLDVLPNSAADRGGLRLGDVITSFDGQRIANPQELSDAIGTVQPGDAVQLDVLRGGELETLSITFDDETATPEAEQEQNNN